MEKEINYFLAVAECRSISKAAELLYVSQPALSRSIANLEKSLGHTLFVRSLSGTELTEAGELYLEYAREVKRLDSSIRFRLKHLGSERNSRIRIGMSLTAASLLTSRISDKVMQKYPETRVEITNIYAKDISTSLCDKRFDFVIGPATFLSAEEQMEIFQSDYYLLAVPERYNIETYVEKDKDDGTFPYIRLEDLPPMDYVFQDENTSVRQDIDKILHQHHIHIRPCCELTSTSLVLQAAASGAGCCFVVLGHIPYAAENTSMRFYRIDTDYRSSAGVISKRGKQFTKEERYCIDCIQSAMREGHQQIIARVHAKKT